MAKGIYVGINETDKTIGFTSNPVPTSWEDSSDYLSATASDKYGEWIVEASSVSAESTYDRGPSKVFDAYGISGSYNTMWSPEPFSASNSVATVTLKLPENIIW